VLSESEALELEGRKKLLARRYAWRRLSLILGIVNCIIGCVIITAVLAEVFAPGRAPFQVEASSSKAVLWIGIWFATIGFSGIGEYFSVKALMRHLVLIDKKCRQERNEATET